MFNKIITNIKSLCIAALCLLFIGGSAAYALARADAEVPAESATQSSPAAVPSSAGEEQETAETVPPTNAQDPSETMLSTGEEPFYKLQENIRATFRSDWEWNEEAQEYTNLGDLVRDPETGLFPEPSPFPENLEGYATWDPYLALYIINTIQIDHETGEIIVEPYPSVDPSIMQKPLYYDRDTDDTFNSILNVYMEYVDEKYYGGGYLAAAYPDLDIFEWEGFTPEWFGLSFSDLPMVIDKLEAGAPSSYTMSLIMLITKTDVGIRPTKGSLRKLLGEWVSAFNALTSGAQEQVKQGNLEELGYLALPYICDELLNGNDSLLSALPEQADGLEGADKTDTAGWSKQDWLDWFENNAETMEVLEYVCQREISMPWLG